MSDASARLTDPVERAAMLAALAAGRASADEVAAIREAAARDPALRNELHLFEQLRRQVREPGDATPAEWGWQRLKRDLVQGRQARIAWLPAAAAAILAVAIVQGVIWWRAEPEGYLPLGDDPGPGTVIQLRFHSEAKQGDIAKLLRSIDAELVAGPAASGLYRIRLPADDPEAEQRALATLRKRGDLVEYAGPGP